MSNRAIFEKSIKLLVGIVMVFIMFVTISALENTISNQQESQIEQLTEVITYEINRTVDVSDLVESYQAGILETFSKDILSSFDGRDFSEITNEELNHILSEYQISGIALFKDTGDDVIIEKSTSETEVGLSTKKWGFWYTAFRQLFDEGNVSLDKGASGESFWIGPRSIAHEQEGFFIFSYFKVPSQPYLLNLFINDKKAFNMVNIYDSNKVFANLVDNADFIDEIAVINVEAWNNRFQHENRSKLQDFTIEYGTYKSFSAEDTYYLNKVSKLDVQDSLSLELSIDNQKKYKRYTKLNDREVLVFLLNKNKQNAVRIRVALTVICGLLSVWLLGYMIMMYQNKKFNRLLQLKKEKLEVAESYMQTVQILPSVVLRLSIVGDKFIVQHFDGKALKLIGVKAESCQGEQLDKFMPSEYIDLIRNNLNKIKKGQSGRFEYKFGERIFENKMEWICDYSDNKTNDSSSDPSEAIILWNDITELRRSEDKARFMAHHDHLTGLPNRHYFKETVESYLKDCNGTLYLAFVDLDGFKNINDAAGHNVGDELLVEVTHRLAGALGGKDFAARMGGDEFAVIFKDVNSPKELEFILGRIKSSICKPYHIEGQKFNIGVSIGISKSPDDGSDYITLLKKADIAMYNVKYSGKGNHKYYKPDMSVIEDTTSLR